MIAASSRDAIRSKGRTGKPARQLRSVWTDAWDRGPDSPGALPMPLQSIISRDAFNSIDRAAAAGNTQARDLVSYFVGQGDGLIDSVKSAGAGVQEFKEDFIEAVEDKNGLVAGEGRHPRPRGGASFPAGGLLRLARNDEAIAIGRDVTRRK